jgi:hypothetical protein
MCPTTPLPPGTGEKAGLREKSREPLPRVAMDSELNRRWKYTPIEYTRTGLGPILNETGANLPLIGDETYSDSPRIELKTTP